jgi:hypothetical protein
MDFKKFLSMMTEAESTAEKDDKAEKAGKKVAKDIEYDEGHKGKDDKKAEKAGEKVKKDIEYDDKKDKKSLKDWFEIIDKNMLAEAEQLTIEPAKQNTQVIRQGGKTIGTVTNPALAANIKAAIGKGEMSLAGKDIKEDDLDEKAKNPYAIGMAQAMKSTGDKPPLKKSTIVKAHDIAKKVMKKEAAEDNPDSAMLDEKWAGDAEVKPTGQYKDKTVAELKAMLAKLHKSGPHDKDSPAAKKQRQINFALRAKGGWKKGEGAAMKEAEIPNSGPDYGAGLGAGRSDNVLETQQVNEAMNTLEAAYHEGKSHGLSKHGYACRYNEGSEEHKRYHDGYKEGLDECYGLMPNRGLVVSEVESEADVVDNMASYGAEEGALGEMDKTAYMQHKAKTTPGDTFKAFGQTFKDKDVLETELAFESLEKQLNKLLESEETVQEGLSVNMSQGLGGMGDDSVSVTATADDAGKLLQFIKQVGLGGLGAEAASAEEPKLVAQISDYGAPKFQGHDDMIGLMKLATDDYKDEEGHDHGDMPKAKMCGTHKLPEGECGCGEGKEMVDEVESEDQMEYQVAEDDGEGYEQGQEAAAQIDAALAVGSENEKSVNEAGDGGEESSPEAAGAVAAADAAEEEDEAMSESSFFNLYKKLALIAEESTAEKDDKAEKAGKKIAKDIEYDEGHKGKDDDKAEKAGEKVKKDIEYDDKKDKKEKVDEWANDAGKDGTEQTFERDIEFMTKVIAGGLNKPKATGQTTIPVIAGQDARTGNEDVSAWKKLAGIAK